MGGYGVQGDEIAAKSQEFHPFNLRLKSPIPYHE